MMKMKRTTKKKEVKENGKKEEKNRLSEEG